MSECTFVTTLSAKRKMIEKIRRTVLKTAEFRTREEKNEEQLNQKLKQGFLGLIKDVIKMADDIQENNKFLNKNILKKDQLKEETTRLINSFLNKKDKTQETVTNLSNLNMNGGSKVKNGLTNGKLIKNNSNKPDDKKDLNGNKDNNEDFVEINNNKNSLNDKNYKPENDEEETILDLHLKYLTLTDNNFTVDSGKFLSFLLLNKIND